ncbi:hypothetical protein MMC10_003337 [Thelotrema lepadinum]|nr:hypothetical protein [Thelotrema lepadinum]
MASRFLHPSRSSKTSDQKAAEKPAKLSKRVSLSAAPVTSSKIPLQLSSRHPSNNKNKTLGPYQTPPQSTVAKPKGKAIQEKESHSTQRGNDQLASGIPRGLNAEMGTHTYVSARQLPSRSRLRRKPSSQDQRSEYASSEPSNISHDAPRQSRTLTYDSTEAQPESDSGSVFGISLPNLTSYAGQYPPRMPPPELAHLQSPVQPRTTSKQLPPSATPELKPPTPGFMRSTSASTRYSESPSPWSNASTPTSASSCSPAISQIPKFATKARPSSPTRSRPPVTRRNVLGPSHDDEEVVEDKGLAAVRESLTSSSSSSTMRTLDNAGRSNAASRNRSLQPPMPPPRQSSKANQEALPTTRLPFRDTRSATQSSSGASVGRGQVQPKLPTLDTSRSKIPPPRPSREGTPVLETKPSPVIQSNLTHLATTGHKRRESAEKVLLISPKKTEDNCLVKPTLSRAPSVTSTASKHGLHVPSAANPAKATSPHLFSRESSRSREPVALRSDLEPPKKRGPSPLFTSPSKSTSRFGFFSRKAKSPSAPSSNLPNEKTARKGPVAGTGHEGYGRYARRGRSSSTSTAASRGRSTSTDRTSYSATGPASSRKSSFTSADGKPELDEFLKDRLEPVIIGGGGLIRDNRNSGLGLYRTESNQSSSTSVQSVDMPVQAPLPQTSYPPSSNASSDDLSSGYSTHPAYRLVPNTAADSLPSLAHRRSLHRMQLFGEAPPVRIPSPINTQVLADSPALETYDSTLSSAPRTDASLPLTDDLSEGYEGNWLKPRKKAQGKSRLKKWNIFHRPQRSSERPLDRPLNSNDSWNDRSVGVSAFGDPRPIAHYAIIDGFESEEPQDLEDALRNIEDNLDFDKDEAEFAPPKIPIQEREPSMLLPSPPKFPSQFDAFPRPPSSAGLALQPLENSTYPENQSSPERSRLQQVGRIPRVVSKRERSFRPSPRSFSRPFASRNNSEQSLDEPLPSVTPTVQRPILGLETDLVPSALFSTPLKQPASAPLTNGMLYNLDDEREFLRFSRRQDSEASGSSGSGILNMAPITAMVPTPDALLSDDEVWGEYDEFLDRVGSPSSASPDTPGLPKFASTFFDSNDASYRTPRIETDSSSYYGSEGHVSASLEMQKPVLPPRPRFLGPLPEQDQLSSPMSLSDLYAGYGSRSSATKSTIRHSNASTISGSRYSTQTIISESASPSIGDEAHLKRVTQVLAEKTYNASSDSLRFSALMTSRWLSFDRVLFSPVQNEIRSSRQDRILVVDGLENDDWSTYCALTYPEANVYNLCSSSALRSRKPTETSNSDKWMPPTNHRRISYANISSPFPFPKGFFTAVVFRFPPANTDYAYRNAISECRRVLRPGGYLEMTILDMDMVNMGPLVSRAIRHLKVRMQAAVPDVSLSPTSDDVMKLLGRKGFENISRCVVGVPVTGAVSDSRSGSMDGERPQGLSSAETGAQLSLGALLTGQTQGSDLHYPVTKMVARVARWWWSKCYESAILGEPREGVSVWGNRALLGECEERETGLKLVVCYAQKPISTRRRTVSV